MTPRLLDTGEAAAYLNVSESTFRGWVQESWITPVRMPSTRRRGEQSRRLLFDVRDLDALIDRWKSASSSVPNAQLSAASLKGWGNRRQRTGR